MPEATPDAGAFASAETFRGQPGIRLQRGAAESVWIALHGAHVLSWVSKGTERLYLSPDAVFDGRAAIRGGVPICLPQFNDRGPLPKHGFARNLAWTAGPVREDGAAGTVAVTLSLDDSEATRALWPHAFRAELTVTLGAGELKLALSLVNTGAAAFDVTAALHSYFAVDSISAARLQGLDGAAYRDTVVHQDAVQAGDVLFDGEVDRIYTAAAAPLRLEGGPQALRIAQSSSFGHTVVWNPGAERCRALADMPDDGYTHMVCVEAAQVLAPVAVAPGAHWSGWQHVSVDV